MAQLTKEHFDDVLKTLAGKRDLEKAIEPLATKVELKGLATKTHLERVEMSLDRKLLDRTNQLKAYADSQITDLRTEIREGFEGVDQKLDALRELLDVRNRVERLEQQVAKLQTRN